METEGFLVPLGSFSIWIGELQFHCVLSETKMKSNWGILPPSPSGLDVHALMCAYSHTYNAKCGSVHWIPSTLEVEGGRSGIEGHPQVCCRFEASWATWGLVNKTNRAGDIGSLVDCSSILHIALGLRPSTAYAGSSMSGTGQVKPWGLNIQAHPQLHKKASPVSRRKEEMLRK